MQLKKLKIILVTIKKMNNENDFHKIGKKTPYRIPDTFFAEITNITLEKAKKREQQFKTRKLILTWSVAASVLVIVSIGIFLSTRSPMTESSTLTVIEPVEQAINIDSAISAENIAQPAPAVANTAQETETAEMNHTETLDDLLAAMSDEELQQFAELISGELFTDELINN